MKTGAKDAEKAENVEELEHVEISPSTSQLTNKKIIRAHSEKYITPLILHPQHPYPPRAFGSTGILISATFLPRFRFHVASIASLTASPRMYCAISPR